MQVTATATELGFGCVLLYDFCHCHRSDWVQSSSSGIIPPRSGLEKGGGDLSATCMSEQSGHPEYRRAAYIELSYMFMLSPHCSQGENRIGNV